MTARTSPASAPPPQERMQMAPEPMDVDADSSEYETDTDAEPEVRILPLPRPHDPDADPRRPLLKPTRQQRPPLAPPAPAPPLLHHAVRPLGPPLPPQTPVRARTARLLPPRHPAPRRADEAQQQQANPVERWAAGDHARIQILDLHTPNPLVSFGNRIWSGSWTAAVGTEIFVRCPTGPAPEDDPDPDPAYVSQKDTSAAAAAGAQVEEEEGADTDTDPAAGEVIATAGVRVHCLPAVLAAKQRGLAAAYASERTYGWRPTGKSSFLERLEEIRVAKGEKRPAGEREEGSAEEGTAGVESETDGERVVALPPVAMGTAFQNRVDGALVVLGAEKGHGKGKGKGRDV